MAAFASRASSFEFECYSARARTRTHHARARLVFSARRCIVFTMSARHRQIAALPRVEVERRATKCETANCGVNSLRITNKVLDDVREIRRIRRVMNAVVYSNAGGERLGNERASLRPLLPVALTFAIGSQCGFRFAKCPKI